jgi:alkyldihydroxyacetonephosphate synthase
LILFNGNSRRNSNHLIDNRSLAIIDMSQMNCMLGIDKINSTACFQSGITIDDLERELNKKGFTVGFERGIVEFSTIGDCIATRSSSKKQNKYGRIVKEIKFVTCKGTTERNDLNEIIFGSDGTLGIITEVTLKLYRLSKIKKCGSFGFTDFHFGLQFIHELTRINRKIANIQLYDEEMFHFINDIAIRQTHSVIVCYLLEGDDEDVRREEKVINKLAHNYRTVNYGSDIGHEGFVRFL